ncbi:DivIVA domain-containing protein [Cellulosilyticum lentocellum]|uniref:DivIVA domain n=1 Tax=Cellulosilyticum lentocellum (strain ATCC 49066 / DSM 5427 / NCIMB 11756 / RHM5) TaxID=642492 RepID=F2JS54_CELLD|nr:DivIVA domain-containing protein [Cellulosilyticum lentocellum]ADZ83991.1 DivIVA domain [Cellulosilyticum lentocellum DSM 5427]
MLSPVDIQNKEFRKSKIGGYHIEEVNDFLDEILKSYQEVINENYALKDKINALNESVQYYRTMESTIQNVLVLADKTAQDTKGAAYEKAEEIKKEAEQRAEKMTSLAEERVARIVEQGRQEAFELSQKVEDIKRQYLSYKAQFKQLLQSQMELLEQGDARATIAQDDLVQAFAAIEKETVASVEVPQTEATEEEYFTKEYIPVSDEEISSLLNK